MDISLPKLWDWFPRLLRRGASHASFSPRAFWEARHQSFAGQLAAVGHAQLSETQNQEQYEIKRGQIHDALVRHVPHRKAKSLLDAGSGIGALTRLYVELGFDVMGIDFSASAIAAARQSGIRAEFHQASLEDFSLRRTFDVVCVIDVLQHIIDDEAYARSQACLSRHTNLGGIVLVVDAMNDEGPSAGHCRRRSLQRHEAEFRIAGLEMVEHSQFALPHENSVKDLAIFIRRF